MQLVTVSRPMQISSPAQGGEQESSKDLTRPLSPWLVPVVWEIGQGDTNVPKIPGRDQMLTSKRRLLTGGMEGK